MSRAPTVAAPRIRIKELRIVKASELVPNPHNWRKHPARQKSVMAQMLERIGYVDALIARETPEGLTLVDGHLRRELSADAQVPVLVLDLSEAEAEEVLLTLDPLTGLAQADNKLLESLVKDAAQDPTFAALFADLTHADSQGNAFSVSPALDYKPQMQLTVTIESEEQAKELYDRLRKEGYQCRLLML